MNNVLKFAIPTAIPAPAPGRGSLSVAEKTGHPVAKDRGKVIDIRLLGKLDILFQGQRLVLPTRHTALLIAVLALEGRLQRETLAARFWGERGEAQARASLRQTIYHANKALEHAGAEMLDVDRRSVGLKYGAFRTDVETLLDELEADPVAAAALSAGELFGNTGRVDPAFQEWLDIERRSFSERITRRLESASAACLANENWTGLETLASWRMDQDPYNESALRHSMVALSKTGQRGAALVLFEGFRKRLHSSLQVAPEAATFELRGRIAAQRVGSSDAGAHDTDRPALPGRNSMEGVTLMGTTQTFVIRNLADQTKSQLDLNNLVEEIVRCGSEQLREQASQSIANLLLAQGQS
ncbi:BTAD domain-containing putative transcriptional regulator [uncultured Roseibium sp.]|uniref:AfsR/SARP family transcriptional regulator n=1 Tax=uncultured Roseibium sp. TaxID=1936171 RepID=UPI002636B65A|nr:BTAD domain-containing putative transcriptional regulator [uncultured Roseibium sp.]